MQESSTIIDSTDVKVVSKRTQSSGEYAQSKYFLTFENVVSGERSELEIDSKDFTLIANGEKGKLINNGKRVLFRREIDEIQEELKKLDNKIIEVNVLSKRMNNENNKMLSTEYFVTFEDISTREQKEIQFSGEKYGLIVEGDTGKLIFKDEKVSFERVVRKSSKIDLVKK